jgi:endoglucanase
MHKNLIIVPLALAAFYSGGFCKDRAALPVVTHPPSLPTVDAGVYDRTHTFDRIHTLAYEVIWCNWQEYREGQLLPELKKVALRGRTPMITIEPWNIPSIGTESSLLTDIAAGKYDPLTSKMAREIAFLTSPTYIRWGAEMEFTEDYPWAKKPANDYIAAFRHFAKIFKEGCPTFRMVWSPVGNEGCQAYYPGDDVVDYAGLSIYELPIASTRWFGHPMSFVDWMQNKYPRIAQYHKPIIVVELGVSDTAEHQKNWLANAFAVVPDYPLIKALIYFNTEDIHSWKKWGAKGAPNWSINPALFTQPLAANQFPLEWTLKEFEEHFGKSTGTSDPSKYTFDNGDYLITASVLNGIATRISYHLKNGQFDEKRCTYLLEHTAPQIHWNASDIKDGLIHFTGKYLDAYAGLMLDNFTTLTIWSKADAEAQITK